MIIDFRVRPPVSGFEKLSIFGVKKGFETYPFDTSEAEPVPSAIEFSMPLFLAEMEEADVGKCVVMGRNTATTLTPPGVDAAEPWGGVSNDAVAAAGALYPDHLLCFGAVDPSGGIREAVQEVDRCVKTLGCRGIVLEPGFCSPPLMPDAARLYPLYDRCAELGVPVAITQSFEGGPRIRYADPESVENAAHDFPSLNFIIVHASYPYILQAASICCFNPNVWLLPDLYMNVPTIPGRELYAEALKLTHGRRMLFGSAYPYRSLRQSVEGLRSLGISPELFRMITHDNAVELLSL